MYKKTITPKTADKTKSATPAADNKVVSDVLSVPSDEVSQSRLARETLISFRQTMFSSKMIGAQEDLIPFAWRNPLNPKKIKKVSKYLKGVFAAEEERNK